MSYVISASGCGFVTTADVKESLDILKESGYTAVDFWLNKFCEKDDAPMNRPDWRDWVKDVTEYARGLGLTIGQVHAHWNHGSEVQEDFSVLPPAANVMNNVEACALMGCDRLVFHPLQRWIRMTDAADRQKVLDANVEWFRYLLPEAEKYGVKICIENLFDHKHIQQEGDPKFAFCDPEDLMYVIEKLDSPLVYTCLDTGHANINAEDIPRMIRMYGDKLGALHLNDNFGKIGPIYEDLHMFPGNGRLEWQPILAALKEIGYKNTMNFEPHNGLEQKTHAERVVMMKFAREMFEVMLEEAGMN